MTPEALLSLNPGDSVFWSSFSIDELDHDDIRWKIRPQVVHHVETEPGGDGVRVHVEIPDHPGLTRFLWGYSVHLSRSAAIEQIQAELREHREACDRAAVELQGELDQALRDEGRGEVMTWPLPN